MLKVYDNFLKRYKELSSYSKSAEFTDIVNPVDGVTYPLICDDIPSFVVSDVGTNIFQRLGFYPKIKSIFLRRSPEGVFAPHEAHTDQSMGKYSMMLYLQHYMTGGTSFLTHKKSGIGFAPENESFLSIIKRDSNDRESWKINNMVNMRANRALIFSSDMIHRAEPIGGFGEGKTARTVLTAFFDD